MSQVEQTARVSSGFATTLWTVVITAGQGESAQSMAALEKLCRIYWQPINAHLLRDGFLIPDAEDLTQGFLAHLLEKNSLASVGREKGRFRSFLIRSLKNYVIDWRRREHAAIRGGGKKPMSLDEPAGHDNDPPVIQPADRDTPERTFEREWALTLLRRAVGRLQSEYTLGGKPFLFEQLHGLLAEEFNVSHREIAERAGMTEAAVKMAAMRLRRRYQEIIREEIAETVSCPEEVEDELNQLFRVFA